MKEVRYAYLHPDEIERRIAAAPIAYMPLGTLEWHGRHLPLGSDGLQSEGLFCRLAREAGGVVLPMLFLGPDLSEVRGTDSYYGMDIISSAPEEPKRLPGSAYWVRDSLFLEIIEASLANLARAGFRIVLLHGHGPSTEMVEREKHRLAERFQLTLATCWRDTEDRDGFMRDHAGANETSIMLALHEELVALERIDAPDWPEGVAGEDPRIAASKKRGKRIVSFHTRRITGFLHKLI